MFQSFLLTTLSFLITFNVYADTESATVKIGTIFSLTGWGQKGGKTELEGVTLAVEDMNAQGGILGKKVELVTENNQSDFKNTATAFQRIFNIHKANVLIGPNWAEFSEVVAPLAEVNKFLMISTTGYSKTLTKGRNYVFTLMPSHREFVRPLAEYIARQKFRKIALLVSSLGYTLSLSEAVQEELETYNIKADKIDYFNPDEKDFRTTFTRIKNGNYDAVINFLIEGSLSSSMRQYKDLQLSAELLSSNIVESDLSILKDPALLVEGMKYYKVKLLSDDDFNRKFEKRFGYFPEDQSPRAYDAAMIYKKAVERCNTFDSQILKDCLKNERFEGVLGNLKFDNNNVIVPSTESAYLMVVRNGKNVRY